MIEKDSKDEQVLRLQDIGAENLARIIVGSALSIPGVNSMSPRLTETIMEGVPGINLELNGVKIEEEKNQILCDLYINVEFGAKIPE
ncbi:MAG: Asp23/Gls24 family envelope stress response protein, partial [Eubacteriales bacterium]|nr:Asp23/Gls24 family envelope stress response protein [Eubacteriales bacterium]